MNPAQLFGGGVQSIFDAMVATLIGPDPSEYSDGRILLGHQYLDANSGAPSVVIVPSGGEHFQSSSVGDPGQAFTLIGSFDLTLEAHCWGVDYNQTKALADAIQTALFVVTFERIQVDGEVWTSSGVGASGYKLIRHFRISPLDIGRIQLPLPSSLDAPITVAQETTVTLVAPVTNTPPSTGLTTQIGFGIQR